MLRRLLTLLAQAPREDLAAPLRPAAYRALRARLLAARTATLAVLAAQRRGARVAEEEGDGGAAALLAAAGARAPCGAMGSGEHADGGAGNGPLNALDARRLALELLCCYHQAALSSRKGREDYSPDAR